jgi:competence CoiA-like predicted nuclease
MKSYILMAEKQKEELRQNFCKVCGGELRGKIVHKDDGGTIFDVTGVL